MKFFTFVFTLLIISVANADITIINLKEEEIKVSEITSENGEFVEFKKIDKSSGKILLNEILEIQFTPKATSKQVEICVRLTNNDLIYGSLKSGGESKIVVSLDSSTDLSIKLENIAKIFFSKDFNISKDNVESISYDKIELVNGDSDEGTLVGLYKDKVAIQSVRFEKEREYSITNIRKISLALLKPVKDKIAGVEANCNFAQGSKLTGKITKISQDKIFLKNIYDEDISFPINSIAIIYFSGGKCIYLSDIEPAEVKEFTDYDFQFYFLSAGENEVISQKRPELITSFKKDSSVSGTTISINNKKFRKGLGVQAHSEIEYTLNKEFKTFESDIGVDDDRRSADDGVFGTVNFVVLADGKKLFERKMKSGDEIFHVKLNVNGVDRLRLIVTRGEDYVDLSKPLPMNLRLKLAFDSTFACDKADWAGAKLLK